MTIFDVSDAARADGTTDLDRRLGSAPQALSY
jgi:hypothetical protein